MDIFENLENLNVSEGCFDDIMDIVEDLIDTIHKKYKYGAPEYYENGGSDLEDKARTVATREYKEAGDREGAKKVYAKRVETKNLKGDRKNKSRHLRNWMKAANLEKPLKSSSVEPYVFFDGNKKR